MEKMFGPSYTGDPGIPHSDKDVFSGIFYGAVGFSLYSAAYPYYWQQYLNTFNWHDWASVCENQRLKHSIKKKKPYNSVWHTHLSKNERDAYYQNWRYFFP